MIGLMVVILLEINTYQFCCTSIDEVCFQFVPETVVGESVVVIKKLLQMQVSLSIPMFAL